MLYEVVFSGTYYGQLWQNKVHFASVNGGGDMVPIAAGIRDNWVFWMRQVQTNDVQWTQFTMKELSAPGGIHVEPLGVTGAQAGEPQRASFICGVMRKNTGLAGRKNRGRIHIPGIRQGGTQLGRIVGQELVNWNITAAQLMAKFVNPTPFGIHLVIKNQEGHVTVTSLTMRDVLGTMRTRNIGVGA